MNPTMQALLARVEQIASAATDLNLTIRANADDVPALLLARTLVELDDLAAKLEDVHDRLAGVDIAEVPT